MSRVLRRLNPGIRRTSVWTVLLLFISSSAAAQRLVERIDLNELGVEDFEKCQPGTEGFIFDTNDIPVSTLTNEQNSPASGFTAKDLNISPQVVYSADSSRGFVAVPGGSRVVVFDPGAATVETTLALPGCPLQTGLTPDGATVIVISLLLERNQPRQGAIEGDRVGAISAIDVQTLEVRTLELAETLFSVGNNVVFSSDSQTGFVASSGTDEIIRFDIPTLSETGRLKVQEGSRPSALTMAPNGTFVAAVLIGSTNLDRLAFPDTISIIDTGSFTQLRTVAPATGPDTDEELLHNFVVYNNLAITSDSRFGVIGEQQNSLVSLIPAITPDRAFILDLETGETVGTATVGGVASGAYLGPDDRVAVISEITITFINVPDKTSRSVTPLGAAFRPSTRPIFVGDNLWVASPISDTLNVINPRTGEISRVIQVGGQVIRGDDDSAVVVPSAPLDLTMTPDGQRATLVNFNGTTLDFVEDTERLLFPRVLGDDGFFTGVALTNTSDDNADVIILGHQLSGQLFPSQAPNRIFNSSFIQGEIFWTFGDGWSLGTVAATASNASSSLDQDVTVVAEQQYEVTFTVQNYESGTVTPELAGTLGTPRSADGTFAEVLTAGDGGTPRFRLVGEGFTGEVTNIQVRLEIIKFDNPGRFDVPAGTQLAQTELEWLRPTGSIEVEGWFDFDSPQALAGLEIVGDNALRRMDGAVGSTQTGQRWILPEVRIDTPFFPNLLLNPNFAGTSSWTTGDGWTIADGVASAAASSGNLEQDVGVTEGTPYEVRFTVLNYESGTVTPVVGGVAGTAVSADGTFTETIVAGAGEAPRFQLVASELTASIDEVRVAQNTPLPPAEGINTEVTLVNPGRNQAAVLIELINDNGEVRSAVPAVLAGSSVFSNFVRDPDLDSLDIDGIFPDLDLIGFTGGYIAVTTTSGVLAFERYLNRQRMSMLNGFVVDNPADTHFVAPQVLAFGDTRSFLTLVSSLLPVEVEEGEDPVEGPFITAQLTLMGNDGQVIKGPVEVVLGPRQRMRRDVAELFGLENPGNGQLISGWVRIETDVAGLVGDVELQLFSQKAMSTIPLLSEPSMDLVFSHIVEGLGLLTGLSLVNPNSEVATVTIEVFQREGDLVDTVSVPIGAGSRLSQLFSEIFNDLPELTGGFVRITSDRPIFAVELFFATNTQFLATVTGQSVGN